MTKLFDKGFTVVVGSRYVPGGNTAGWNWWRNALSYYGNVYSRLVTGIPVQDLTAGFYMIDANLLRSIDLNDISSSGYAFQIELKYLLRKNGGKFFELPIVFEDRRVGKSKMSGHIINEGVLAPWKIIMKEYRK